MYRMATLDGNKIIYTDSTTFLVEVGFKHRAYKTRYTFTGNLHQALLYYKGINVGNGYKKRLVMPDARKPVLAREIS